MPFRFHYRVAVASLAASCLFATAPAALADGGSTALTNVIALAARRLAFAAPVALIKWQTGKPVTDAPREQQLLADVAAKAKRQGIDPSFANAFFSDQIEASKVIQQSLFDQWHRSGGPKEPAPDLATIRLQIDRLDAMLIPALARVEPIRSLAGCSSELAQSLSNWKQLSSFDSSQSDALIDALKHVCEQGGVAVQG